MSTLSDRQTGRRLSTDGFARAYNILRHSLPGVRLSDAERVQQMRVWYEMLADLTDQQLYQAVTLYCRNGADDWPSVAKLRRMLGHIDGAALDPKTRAIKCWDAVFAAIASVGSYQSVNFDDPIANATIRGLGGWEWLCEQLSDDMKWVRMRFVEIYEAFSRTGISADAARPLIGFVDRTNGADGYCLASAVSVECGLPAPDVRILDGPRKESQRRLTNTIAE